MKIKSTVFAAALAVSAASFGQVIYSQAPIPNGEGGAFSYPSQSIADNFTVVGDFMGGTTSYNHVAFWGSYLFGGDNLSIGSKKSFVIRRYNTILSTSTLPWIKLSEIVVNATVTQKTTVSDFGDTVYRFDADVDQNIIQKGEQYFLNVEATDTAFGFRWHTSAKNDTIAVSSNDGGASWNPMNAPRQNMAFELSQAVPEPATLLVMGIGAIALAKRRRR